ncbi:hypothetical protein [Saccharopolyspora taberi]|uniref:Uncharacterized protein n=1 Tax=Saccharopolyspora taberi TaxID=60895 RepID=A0ABN3V6F0_9PSEU
MHEPQIADVVVTIPADVAARLTGLAHAYREAVRNVFGCQTGPVLIRAAAWREVARTASDLGEEWSRPEITRHLEAFPPLASAARHATQTYLALARSDIAKADRLTGGGA